MTLIVLANLAVFIGLMVFIARLRHLSLSTQILIGLVFGAAYGGALQLVYAGNPDAIRETMTWTNVVGTTYINLLKMVVMPLVLVMMGMVVSFIGGVLLLPIFGVSINMISLFGFLVVLGIVVDDAVVVGENVYEKRQSQSESEAAAIKGTEEVAAPVTFSVLTNIVAFLPLMFIPGETGKFWGPLPVVVIIVLALSLVESLFILPAHLAHTRPSEKSHGIGAWLHRAQQRFSRGFSRLVDFAYRPVLTLCLRFRYVTASLALATLIVVGGYATSSHMGMVLMPEVSADEIEAGVRMPVGTTPDQAAQNCRDRDRRPA